MRSKRLREASLGDMPTGLNYCRKCGLVKRSDEFYKAIDTHLDSNGLMSICKEDIGKMFVGILESENGSIQKAVLRLCKMLNVLYDEETIGSALKQIETRGWASEKLFGVYLAKLTVTQRSTVTDTSSTLNLTYQDNPVINLSENLIIKNDDFEGARDLKLFWGDSFAKEDLEILESKYSEWSQSHDISTQSERVLLKYICLKEYDIDKAVKEGKNTSGLMKEFQELLKTSGLNPSSATLSSTGKSQETWGGFVKVIEETTPAEYYKDKDLFKDHDNLTWIWNNFVVRSIKNFMTGSKDFTLQDIDVDYEDVQDEPDTTDSPSLIYKPEE